MENRYPHLKSPSRRSFFTTQATMGDISNLFTKVPTMKNKKHDVGPTHPVLLNYQLDLWDTLSNYFKVCKVTQHKLCSCSMIL
jgi:hypothetical protein